MRQDDPAAPGRSVALINQKGGVGKTTTTVNLAAAVALEGRRTLIVDLDPQAHASLHLGVEPGSTTGTVYSLLHEPESATPDVLARPRENLLLLPSETDLAAAESELSGEPDRFTRLQSALRRILDAERAAGTPVEWVFVDCPPSLGLLTLSGLVAAREVVVPMQAHFLALQGLGKLLETVALVRRELNPKLRVSGVILTMHDPQTTHTREVVADLENFFAESRKDEESPWRFARILQPPIRRNIKLAECPSFGQTIFDYAAFAPGALDYRKLARTLVKEWDEARTRLRKPAPHAEPKPDASPAAAR